MLLMISLHVAEAHKSSRNYFSAHNELLSALIAVTSKTELFNFFWLFSAQLRGSQLFAYCNGFHGNKKERGLRWKVVTKELISLLIRNTQNIWTLLNQVIIPCLFTPL